jgi:hypothetical protein
MFSQSVVILTLFTTPQISRRLEEVDETDEPLLSLFSDSELKAFDDEVISTPSTLTQVNYLPYVHPFVLVHDRVLEYSITRQ